MVRLVVQRQELGAGQQLDRSLTLAWVLLMQEQTQGPCSIAQFQGWLRKMGGTPALRTEFEQFKAVSVWRVRILSSKVTLSSTALF